MRESSTIVGRAIGKVASLLVVLLLAIGPYSVSAGASYLFDSQPDHAHVVMDQIECTDSCAGDHGTLADEHDSSQDHSSEKNGKCDPLCVGSTIFSDNSAVVFVTPTSTHGPALTERLYGDEWASLHRPPNA